MEPVSNIKSEMEYLYGRGSKFRVTGYAESGDARHPRLLLIEEVDAAIPESQLAPKRWEWGKLWKEFEENAKQAGF